ncbi:MAG: hypothetical protein HW403_1186 [Dehalococcoidia bacterium]|nr:hypothetical protein [Dehalococcoidia bacterium]
MCGIAGILNFNGSPVTQEVIEGMCGHLAHRGPDDTGVLIDGSLGLGFRRLSIIDLAGGHQPMSNEDGSVWVVFNGEIYNFRELTQELIAKGHTFRTRSDTESIVHAYEEYGEDFVQRLRGMFALAIWDGKERKLLLARDRLGIKPLYYWAGPKGLAFASELKALVAVPQIPWEPDPQGIYQCLTFRFSVSPQTVIKGVAKLPPAHILVCHEGNIRTKQYWELPPFEDNGRPFDEEKAVHELRDLLDECVASHLVSDVPLGAFLSGGVDSSSLVALMSRHMNQPVKTYSVGFGVGKPLDELDYARRVAQYLGTDHHEVLCESASFELLEEIALHLDEPILDPAVLPTYLVSQRAREDVTVVLTGEGSDETNLGYDRYFYVGRQARRFPRPVREAIHAASFLNRVYYLRGFVNLNWMSLDSGYSIPPMRYDAHHGSEPGLFHPDFIASVVRAEPLAQARSAIKGADVTRQAAFLDMKGWLPDDLLMKVDRMTMAHSLEARVPFLDHKFVEFAWSLPVKAKIQGHTTKALFRKAMKPLLPQETLNRRQHGFELPLDRWFRGDLRSFVYDLALDTATISRGFFTKEGVSSLLEDYYTRGRGHHLQLWAVVMLELWHRSIVDVRSKNSHLQKARPIIALTPGEGAI